MISKKTIKKVERERQNKKVEQNLILSFSYKGLNPYKKDFPQLATELLQV